MYSKASSYPLLLSSTKSSEKCESPNANESLGFSQSKYFFERIRKRLIERAATRNTVNECSQWLLFDSPRILDQKYFVSDVLFEWSQNINLGI